jgi:hypothetical protein
VAKEGRPSWKTAAKLCTLAATAPAAHAKGKKFFGAFF